MTSEDADRASRIRQFFNHHLLSRRDFHDLSAIRSLLPTDQSDLHVLQAHCMSAAREAMYTGRHTEMQRLDHLAPQLARLSG